MKKYVRILEEVIAIKAQEDNIDEIKKIVPDAVKIETVNGIYYDVGIMSVLWVNSWLIKHSDGSLEVMLDKTFKKNYELK